MNTRCDIKSHMFIMIRKTVMMGSAYIISRCNKLQSIFRLRILRYILECTWFDDYWRNNIWICCALIFECFRIKKNMSCLMRSNGHAHIADGNQCRHIWLTSIIFMHMLKCIYTSCCFWRWLYTIMLYTHIVRVSIKPLSDVIYTYNMSIQCLESLTQNHI